MSKTKMQQTSELGTDFWNDSCSVKELTEAVGQGAVGATSNPVIVYNVIKQEMPVWQGVLDQLIKDHPEATEDEVTWHLIEHIGCQAARILEPVFQQTGGRKGRLSLQVNPKFYRSSRQMVAHARHLAAIAPNIAIKLPCTLEGLAAVEEVTSLGVCVNVTVSFTVAQALAAAEAIERGLKKASASGLDVSQLNPYVTIMVGRLDDQLKRILAKDPSSTIDPGYLEWAGVAAFKKAYRIFQERKYRSTLLSAAYRNHMHWSEFVGGPVVVSIPYEWWQRFNASSIEVRPRIDVPVKPEIIEELYARFPDFRAGYDEEGLKPAEFVRFGASIHTLNQFIGGYSSLLEIVRGRLIR
jgi:transaldolase